MQYGTWLSQPREIGIFTRPRILLREITGPEPYCLNFAFTDRTFLNNKSILNILDLDDSVPRLLSLIGILNSRLMSFFYKQQAVKSGRKIFPKVVVKDLGQFPIPKDLTKHDGMTSLVKAMSSLHDGLGAAKSRQKDLIQRQIEATDRQIDRLVYQLYCLGEQEIAVIENASSEPKSTVA